VESEVETAGKMPLRKRKQEFLFDEINTEGDDDICLAKLLYS
jgi:hypothetical protein